REEAPDEKYVPIEERIVRAGEQRLYLAVGRSHGYADRREGAGVARLTPALLAERSLAQDWFLESLALYLASHYRRATLHAACIAYRGCGALLTGCEGAGKSTLAYACVRAGCQLVAEDVVYADPDDPAWVWGHPRCIHLMPDSTALFPELAGAEKVPQLNGETKLAVRVQELRPDAALAHIAIRSVLSLSRYAGRRAMLSAADPNDLRAALTGFTGNAPLDRAAMQAAAARLASGCTAHLRAGSDPEATVATLLRWLCAGGV
ncbi:MAG TPA: hypothetical protein VKT32_04915, partial [Chthonomonadaceae bacterium]|nr:hypothetical protein [Chthonomonadaceae bacterium]